jgi:hypothetical protein
MDWPLNGLVMHGTIARTSVYGLRVRAALRLLRADIGMLQSIRLSCVGRVEHMAGPDANHRDDFPL